MVVPLPARVSLTVGIDVPQRLPTSKQPPSTEACTTTDPSSQISSLNPIFMHGGAPKAHDVLPEMLSTSPEDVRLSDAIQKGARFGVGFECSPQPSPERSALNG
jgi:hypothetical protein